MPVPDTLTALLMFVFGPVQIVHRFAEKLELVLCRVFDPRAKLEFEIATNEVPPLTDFILVSPEDGVKLYMISNLLHVNQQVSWSAHVLDLVRERRV